MSRRPIIGVFDSGFGGLTVLRELVGLIPASDYLYFGDTARLPYGSKSAETVARYAVGASNYLESHGAEMLVVRQDKGPRGESIRVIDGSKLRLPALALVGDSDLIVCAGPDQATAGTVLAQVLEVRAGSLRRAVLAVSMATVWASVPGVAPDAPTRRASQPAP